MVSLSSALGLGLLANLLQKKTSPPAKALTCRHVGVSPDVGEVGLDPVYELL